MEKNLSDVMEETFKESKGLPEVEHKKKLVKREKENQKKLAGLRNVFFTQKGQKILKLIVKPRGIHSVFVGRIKKDKAEQNAFIKSQIEKWKSDGVFVQEHQIEEKLGSLVKELSKKEQDILSGKK